MNESSRTIGQSRTFARGVCIRLENTWWPCETLLHRFRRRDAAVRACKGKSWWYVLRHYGRSYGTLVTLRDKALRDLLAAGKNPIMG